LKPSQPEVAVDRKARARADRDSQKKLKAVERKIARLDDEKRGVGEKLLSVTDAAEARRLQTQLTSLTAELATLEEEWLELSSELDAM
jgi:ATP-binding cassette subfamily F protein 3